MKVRLYYGPKTELVGTISMDQVPSKGDNLHIGDADILRAMGWNPSQATIVFVDIVSWEIIGHEVTGVDLFLK